MIRNRMHSLEYRKQNIDFGTQETIQSMKDGENIQRLENKKYNT